METLVIQQGDSARIEIVLPLDKMAQVQDVVCTIGSRLSYSLNKGTLTPTATANVFHLDILSIESQRNTGNLELVVAIDYSDIGVKKTKRAENLIVQVVRNENYFNNNSISELVSAVVVVTVEEEVVTAIPILASYLVINGGGGGATNLGYTPSPTNGIVTSDTGTDATIPLASNTNAGLLSPSEKTAIANIPTPITNLTQIATRNYSDLQGLPNIPTTADQLTETATRVFVTPSEKTAITHSNRSILNAITEAFTTSLKNAYDGVVTGYNALILTGSRLITTGEITKLSNTSGTNTGDETTSSIQTKRPLKTIEGQTLEGVGNIDLTKSDVGLSNVDNTSDASKPISSATQTALNGKQNILFNELQKKEILIWEDFIGGSLNSSEENWGVSTRVNGGATITQTSSFPNRTSQEGVVRMSAATINTDATIRIGGFNSDNGIFFGNGAVSIVTYLCFETLSNDTDRFYKTFGFFGSSLVSNTFSYSINYDEGGILTNSVGASPNFKVCTFNNSTRIATDTGIPVVAGQWYKLAIVVNANHTAVEFYINNVLVVTRTTALLWNAGMNIRLAYGKTTGVANRNIFCDYIGLNKILTTPRP